MKNMRHSVLPRGLISTPRSPTFEAHFGRMFRALPTATFGQTEADNVADLKAIADAMTADLDKPKDGKDEEESGIPALYTYLGQFIDHDITFDPASSLQKRTTRTRWWTSVRPRSTSTNLRARPRRSAVHVRQ